MFLVCERRLDTIHIAPNLISKTIVESVDDKYQDRQVEGYKFTLYMIYKGS